MNNTSSEELGVGSVEYKVKEDSTDVTSCLR